MRCPTSDIHVVVPEGEGGGIRKIPVLTPARLWLVVLVAVLQAGCGFQLRGSAGMPEDMTVTYVKGLNQYSDLVDDFVQALRVRKVDAVTAPDTLAATLQVNASNTEKLVQSVDTAGNVLEFEIRQTIRFTLYDREGNVLLPQQIVTQRRDFLFTSTDVLAKQREENIVRRALQRKVVDMALLRITTLVR